MPGRRRGMTGPEDVRQWATCFCSNCFVLIKIRKNYKSRPTGPLKIPATKEIGSLSQSSIISRSKNSRLT